MTEKTLFFPAAGNYNGTSLNNRGSNGNYWSSSWISATNARNLNFNSSSVNPQNSNNRRNGFSLRGVSTYCYSILLYLLMTLTKEKLLKDLYVAFYDARKHKAKMSYVLKFEENFKENMEKNRARNEAVGFFVLQARHKDYKQLSWYYAAYSLVQYQKEIVLQSSSNANWCALQRYVKDS